MAARFKVGGHLVDPGSGAIWGAEGAVHVEPLVMAVLERLIEKRGETVSKDELLRTVWEGRYVTEDAVHRTIGMLRKALGDRPTAQEVIQTIPKRGYRLLAPVEVLEPIPDGVRKTRSRLTLEAVLASCSDHIYVYDSQGRYLYASEEGARAVGLTAGEMIGRGWEELEMPAEIMEPFHDQVAAVFAGGPSVRQRVSYPTIYGERVYEYVLDAIAGDDEIFAVMAVVREIREPRKKPS